MSVKACVGGLIVGAAVGMAMMTVFPAPMSQKSARRVRRYIKKML